MTTTARFPAALMVGFALIMTGLILNASSCEEKRQKQFEDDVRDPDFPRAPELMRILKC